MRRALFQLVPAAALCALFAGVGIVHVTSRVMVVNVGYTLSTLEQESRTLTRENEQLRLELATLKNPARLEKLARQEGMGPPPPGTVVTVTAPLDSAGGERSAVQAERSRGPRVEPAGLLARRSRP